MGTVNKEEYKTLKEVFDNFTERNLFKLITQGYIDGIGSPVSIGKEGNVFTAIKEDETRIVKIYRLQTCDFNKMYEYIKRDPRYISLKKKRREVIFAWAHREFRNLLKAREAGVRVPTPLTVLSNILVMEYIGDEDGAAPRLKDKRPVDLRAFFEDLKSQVKLLYDANIIHGDLSAFNVLNHNEKPVIIDMSQSMPLEAGNAMEFLERDVKNMCSQFKKWGLVIDDKTVFEEITKQ